MTLISHDPFAREELHRTVIKSFGETCSECGQLRGNAILFRYHIIPDARPSAPDARNAVKGAFCSIGCMRAYHGH